MSREHLVEEEGAFIHRDCLEDFLRLKEAAAKEGIHLRPASSWRSFERQLIIWREKTQGARPVLNKEGEEQDISRFTPRELVWAILRWSALPGFSRHHRGTDLDVYDGAAGIKPRLLPEEYGPRGPFAKLSAFLAEEPCGFFRPYQKDRGGIAPEPWHISHKNSSRPFDALLSLQLLQDFLRDPPAPIPLAEIVAQESPAIFARFIASPPAAAP